jgi:thioredoxin-related protein
MDHNTYENPVIATIINDNYYAVKLDAEQTSSIFYKGKEYKFIKQGKKGYNEFAASILHGEMSYPSTVFMDQDERLIQKLPGYFDPKEMEPILLYFAQQNFLSISWETFKEEFISNL